MSAREEGLDRRLTISQISLDWKDEPDDEKDLPSQIDENDILDVIDKGSDIKVKTFNLDKVD